MSIFLQIITVLLIFFSVFSFGATEPWAQAIVQCAVAVCAILYIFNNKRIYITPLLKPVIFIFTFICALALIQAAFPSNILEKTPLYPISLARLYTLEAAAMFFSRLLFILLISQLFYTKEAAAILVKATAICALLTILTAFCFPGAGYIHFFTGVKGGIGPFLNRNNAGVFFAMGSIYAITCGIYSYFQYKKHPDTTSPQQFYVKQFFWAAASLSLIIMTIYTRSRGAMLALSCSLVFYAFMLIVFFAKTFKTRFTGASILAAFSGLAAVIAAKNTAAINVFTDRVITLSVDIRLEIYQSALRMLKQFPLFGTGLGAMPVALPNYIVKPIHEYVEHLHNDWLEILLGAGVIGMAVILCGMAWFAYVYCKNINKLGRRKKVLYFGMASIIVLMAIACAVDYHFFVTANSLMLCIALGILGANTMFKDKAEPVKTGPICKILFIIVALISLWLPVNKAIAWRTMLFGKGLLPAARIAHYENALTYYDGHRYALRTGMEYLRQSKNASLPPDLRAKYKARALEISKIYLTKYPKERELSRLYLMAVK